MGPEWETKLDTPTDGYRGEGDVILGGREVHADEAYGQGTIFAPGVLVWSRYLPRPRGIPLNNIMLVKLATVDKRFVSGLDKLVVELGDLAAQWYPISDQ